VLDDVRGIGTDTGENRRRLGVQPRRADGAESGFFGDAAHVSRVAPLVQDWELHPLIDRKPADLLQRSDQPLNVIGGELGASDSPRGEVGYLIGVDDAASYERGKGVVGDAEVLARRPAPTGRPDLGLADAGDSDRRNADERLELDP
jgi:hypothetical protein